MFHVLFGKRSKTSSEVGRRSYIVRRIIDGELDTTTTRLLNHDICS